MGEKIIMLEKPLALNRIFFSICAITDRASWHEAKVSFDDPLFRSYYVINGPEKYFTAEGEDIFQGNIWVYNFSNTNLLYSATEILH